MFKHYTDLANTEYLALQLHQRDLGKACKDATHYKEVITSLQQTIRQDTILPLHKGKERKFCEKLNPTPKPEQQQPKPTDTRTDDVRSTSGTSKQRQAKKRSNNKDTRFKERRLQNYNN